MLADAIAAALPRLRAEAEARMTSRVTIRRATGHTVQDETTGAEVPVWELVATDLPFRLGGTGSGQSPSRREDIGGVEVQVAVRIGHLPASATGLSDGDFIDVTAGENAGTAWRIVEVEWKDQATARRVPLLAVDRPEEWS